MKWIRAILKTAESQSTRITNMDLHKQLFKRQSALGENQNTDFATRNRLSGSLKPLIWDQYFEKNEQVCLIQDDLTVNVYLNGSVANTGPVYFIHHGAGLSAMSFGVMAKELYKKDNTSTVVCFDCRGHGLTAAADETDLSLTRLVSDSELLLKYLFNDSKRPIILVGHSMGGAVIVSLALSLQTSYDIAGIVVVDVVEGTAINSFQFAKSVLVLKRKSFPSIESAIKYQINTGDSSNTESACLSVPSLLKKITTPGKPDLFTWRTNVLDTSEHWTGWYEDLSKKFLSVKTAKLLVLAETDRLDKELMIAQMQGKFQLVLFHGSGHLIQENHPYEFANKLHQFANRNKRLDMSTIKRMVPLPHKKQDS
ncbi:hypothetical protein BB560_001409 [Smittium megazygosporum]|uniref:Protein phosphatase methylesterase 1 n=1 Tax=Smittium megazygosporum TaxID=133381 RepID=A0A2T9ZHL8_9FUNG|nr:hypothetical protein BB560_001412 [Smittium megazygosporum]PVV04094.1 hypothetical protein BB560_001409 [Smittium megazygosporum]